MSFSNSFRMIALASAAVVLPAQESTRIAGPTSGLVYDAPSRALRVVMGVPGAAYLGGALAVDLDGGSVSPNGRFALTIADGALNLVSLADQTMIAVGSAGCAAQGSAALAWSADSSLVALGCAEGARMFRIAGGAAERLPLAAVDGVTSLAVDAAGVAVFATRADGIYRIDAESARLLAAVENAAGLVLAGADTLYAVDRAGKRVLAVDHLATSAALRQVAGEAQGLVEPVAVGVSADGQQLFVAEAGEGSRAVRVFNTATLEMRARVELDFDPARVDALGNGLYLLNARKDAGDTMHVLDARQMSVYFVPAQDLGSVANLED